MNRVFIDMDGVIVDFDKYMTDHNMPASEVKVLEGAYLNMEPMPGALDAVRKLIEWGFDVWIATKPPTAVPHASSEKVQWILNHLPELKRNIIITPNKGLLGDSGDWLIDDRPHKANCEDFAGELITYIPKCNNWNHILTYFQNDTT